MPGYALAVAVVPRRVAEPLWAALRAAEAPLTIRELHISTAAHPNAIQLRLKRWERAGLVTATATSPRRFAMADQEPRCPAMTAKGIVRRTPTKRQRLWTAMRVLKRFDLPTLIMTAEATRRSAEDFVNVLCRAGYLKMVERGNSMTGVWSTYRLQRRTGPRAPIVSHSPRGDGRTLRILVDPNDGSRHDISPGTIDLNRCVRRARGVNHAG